MLDQGRRVGVDVGIARSKQFRLDGMEPAVRIRPCVDLCIEFRNETGGKHLRTPPAGARRNPGLLCTRQIRRRSTFAQRARTRQRVPDSFDQVGPIALGSLLENAGVRGTHASERRQQSKARRHSHLVHRQSTHPPRRAHGTQRRGLFSASYTVL